MTKSLSLLSGILFSALLISFYFIIPIILVRFYESDQLNQVLNVNKNPTNWINRYPERILVLALLFIFYLLCSHIPIFFRGIFPFFGILLHNMQGIMFIVFTLFILLVLTFGILNRKKWAWWGSILFFFVWLISIIITFLNNSYLDILAILSFPKREMDVFQSLPLLGYHFVLIFGIPIVLTIIFIYTSKKYLFSK